MSNLIHVIYASRDAINFTENKINSLLLNARDKNRLLNVTGILLFDDGHFLQVLEGEDKTVKKLYAEICSDLRHDAIVKIIEEAIPKRAFKDWSMGYSDMSDEAMKDLEGTNDFFRGGRCLAKIDAGRAKKIIKAFELGRWRIH